MIRVGEKWDAAVARLYKGTIRHEAWRSLTALPHASLTCLGFMIRLGTCALGGDL
jgi:hypothetical protein